MYDCQYLIFVIMQKYIAADWVFPVFGKPIRKGVLCLSADGKILNILSRQEAEKQGITDIDYYQGALIPGLVNTHCHLELSHLWKKIKPHTGLPDFIKQFLALRKQDESETEEAMEQADLEMYHNGIVAVGDIANEIISKRVKTQSKLYYHTFIEIYGFNRSSEPIIAEGQQLKKNFEPLKASIVPHAPYSVSSELFAAIARTFTRDDVQTIHNQETLSENELFETGQGELANVFAEMGIAQSDAYAGRRNAIRYHLPLLNTDINTLLVHNTFSCKADVEFAAANHLKLFWCLCPKANQYIENTLPDIHSLKDGGAVFTLGTDSLASNAELNILAEMKILQEEKGIHFEELLQWATINGAQFLNIDNQYGSFTIGKKPGVVLIDLNDKMQIGNVSQITRII